MPDGSHGAIPPRGRRWRRRVGLSLSLLCGVVLILAGVLAVQLANRPLDLHYLRTPIEQALRAYLPPGAGLAIGGTAVSFRRHQGFVLEARDVRVTLPETGEVAAEVVAVAADAGALLSGQLRVRSVALEGVLVDLRDVALVEPIGPRADRARGLMRLFAAALAGGERRLQEAGLRELRIADGRFVAPQALVRQPDGTPLTIPVLAARWSPGRGKGDGLEARIEGGGSEFAVEIRSASSISGRTAYEIAVRDFPAALLALAAGDRAGPSRFDAPVELKSRIELAPNGAATATGRLVVGAGLLTLDEDASVIVDEARLSFALPRAGNDLLLRDGSVQSGPARFTFGGSLDLAEFGKPMRLAAILGPSVLPKIRPDDPDVTLTGGDLDASLSSADGLDVRRLVLQGPQGTASLAGHLRPKGEGAGLALALRISEMPAPMLLGLWPPHIATKTRAWIAERVAGGEVGPGTLLVALPPDFLGGRRKGEPLPPYALKGAVSFRHARVLPLDSLPPLEDAGGTVTFEDAAATVALDEGRILLPDGKAVAAAGTTFRIPELGRREPAGDLKLDLSGATSALVALARLDPIDVPAARSIDPAALSGDARLSVSATIPLRDASLADLRPQFRLALTDFASRDPIEKMAISDADLVLEGRPDEYSVRGKAVLDGVEADVDMAFRAATPGTTQIRFTLDEEARKRLGVDPGEVLSGPIGASVRQVGAGKAREVALDLKAARLSLPFAAWEKGKGVPAEVKFTIETGEDGTVLRDLSVVGDGFHARGEIRIGKAGDLVALDFPSVALRSGDDFAVSVRREGKGYVAEIRGARFDARALTKVSGEGGGAGGGLPISLSVSLKDVKGHNGVSIAGLSGSARLSGGSLRGLSLQGTTGRGEPFRAAMQEEGGARHVSASAADGGAVLRFLDLYTKVSGGRLDLTFQGAAGASDGSGELVLQDFHIVNEAALQQAVQRGAEPGGRRGRGGSEASDMRFSRLKIPFRRQGDVVAIDEAYLRGLLLGGTGSGTVNLRQGQLVVTGTIVPAYGLNNIAGKVPLFGQILAGGRNEGVVGITYRVSGSIASPKLQMNPLSAITPGILRKVFEYR